MASVANSLCFIVTCKGRLEHLKQTLPLLDQVANTQCVVVDYACPQNSGLWVQLNFPDVQVEFVTDDTEFCLSRARNIGAAAATTPWLCFIDADICINPGFAAWLQQPRKANGIYRAEPVELPMWGSMICRTEAFLAVGGYDEVIRGWGGEDDDLYLRMRDAGNIDIGFPAELLQPIAHADELRTRFYPIKDHALQHRINFLYTHLKHDIEHFAPEFLTIDGRQQIMAEASKTVLAAAGGRNPAHFEVELANLGIPQLLDWRVSRKITYDMQEIAVDASVARPVTATDETISVSNGAGLNLKLKVIPGEATQTLCQDIFLGHCYAGAPMAQVPANIVDIGAGVGLTAAYFRLIYPNAKIYCFESDVAALTLLFGNVVTINNAEVNPQASTSRDTGSATALDALAFLPQIDILKLASAASNLPILSSLRPRLAGIHAIYVEFSSVTMRDKVTSLLGDALRNSHVLWKAQVLTGGSSESATEQRGVLIYVQQSALVEAS